MDDRHGQADETGSGAGYVAPVGAVGRRWTTIPLVAVVGLALLVALVKPWNLIGAGPRPSGVDRPAGTQRPVSVPSAVVQGPDAAEELTSICHNTDAWLLATVETSRDQVVRVLRVLPASSVAKPDDSGIPRLAFGSETVTELGWCAPVTGSERSSGVTSVEAWSLAHGTPRALVLRRDQPVGGASGFGALYGPPAGASVRVSRTPDPGAAGHPGTSDPSATSWKSGTYEFRLRTADGVVESYAVEIEIVPWKLPARAGPSGAPTTRPTPAP